ncbi:MAG: type 1 glutamine amidotransferase [Actinobacteria bacterium]|nr:type 1 glutamine amidotransferase [Actinomycetota bacterium]MCL5883696.1 type 1 glutamine amidotransferase [Actinomycetota bacterium]
MSKVMVIQNVGCEPLGRFSEADAEFVYIRPFLGEPLPQNLDGWDALVVLGGPMAAYESGRSAFLGEEIALLGEAIAEDFPVLGVCLGSQLIAKAAGARVYAGPVRELGWGSVQLTEAAETDALFSGLPRELPVFQLHGDTFDLPRDAVRLAENSTYANQAFRIGGKVYGVQFHVEVVPGLAKSWVDEYADYLKTGGASGEEILRELDEKDKALRPVANTLIGRFLKL